MGRLLSCVFFIFINIFTKKTYLHKSQLIILKNEQIDPPWQKEYTQLRGMSNAEDDKEKSYRKNK